MSQFIRNEKKRTGARKQHDLRIDFAPMVDLGFLLITFFILTTALSKPNVMSIVMPETDCSVHDLMDLEEYKVLTLLLADDNEIFFYEGLDLDSIGKTDFSANGLRKLLLEKKEKVRAIFPDVQKIKSDGTKQMVSQLYVCIKPLNNSTYGNTVDVLDELMICGVSIYSVLEVSSSEADKIYNSNQ